jgi:hypothetical protein
MSKVLALLKQEVNNMSDNVNKLHESTVDFYVWSSKVNGGTGHMGVGYTTAKENGYHAIWPKSNFPGLLTASIFGAVGMLFCPGEITHDLNDEVNVNEEREPDYIVKIPVASQDIEKVKKYFESQRQRVQSGQHVYCLTPKTPFFLRFFQSIAHPLGGQDEDTYAQELARAKGDPIPLEEEDLKIEKEIKNVTAGHCVSEGLNVLSVLGMSAPESSLPHHYTPDGLGELLQKRPNSVVEYPEKRKGLAPWDSFVNHGD